MLFKFPVAEPIHPCPINSRLWSAARLSVFWGERYSTAKTKMLLLIMLSSTCFMLAYFTRRFHMSKNQIFFDFDESWALIFPSLVESLKVWFALDAKCNLSQTPFFFFFFQLPTHPREMLMFQILVSFSLSPCCYVMWIRFIASLFRLPQCLANLCLEFILPCCLAALFAMIWF